MRNIQWPTILLAAVPTGMWAQQARSTFEFRPSSERASAVKSVESPPTGQTTSCPAKWEFHPETDGIYEVGADVKPPKAKQSAEPTFSEEARKMIKKRRIHDFHAVSVIGFTVSAEGKPQDPCVIKAAGWGLDEQAILAVEKFCFAPATRNGAPVAVRIAMDVSFKAY